MLRDRREKVPLVFAARPESVVMALSNVRPQPLEIEASELENI